MTLKDLSPTVETLLGMLAPFGGVLALLAFGWVLWRTHSLHALRFRTWRLIHGRAEIRDVDIERFIHDRNELMAFRFLSGIKVRTVESARALARWMRDHNEEIRAVRAAGPFFDAETLRVKTDSLPGWKLILVILSVASGLLFGSLYLLKLAASEHVFLKVHRTETWLGVTPEGFAPTDWVGNVKGPLLKHQDCQSGVGLAEQSARVGVENAKVLCELLLHPDGPSYLESSLTQQRGGMGFLSFVIAWGCVYLFLKVPQAEAARRLHGRVESRAPRRLPPY